MPVPITPLIDRLERHSKKVGDCWEWLGKKTAHGYGTLRLPTGSRAVNKHDTAHRISYRVFHPEWDGSGCVLHRCDNRVCWNPTHLFIGTLADNVRDMASKRRNRRGEQHQGAKLTETQVREIKGSVGGSKTLAKQYGVTHSNIDHIRSGKTWRHLDA